ncbi:hypothetical protein PAXINDRAFT_168349 [Paxillus involutus ATCC 200175]|nr:hypothetical protein PAXINDRAFT_168349 [Paxillus involutus ATCC 200175]
MPVNHLQQTVIEVSQDISQPQAAKYCSHCSSPLNTDSVNAVFILDDHDSNVICATCSARSFQGRSEDTLGTPVDPGLSAYTTLPSINARQSSLQSTHTHPEPVFVDDIEMHSSPTSSTLSSLTLSPLSSPYQSSSALSRPSVTPPSKPSLSIRTTTTPFRSTSIQQRTSPDVITRGRPQRTPVPAPVPDPTSDITRLRVRSQGHHCLYPGATFQGTQKSGRNSYDVNVTIVDVDFSSSFLCGYLRIRGLTDDWPELTTYFDAEIIGNRYGFLTQKWGANEQEDMVHWNRFPAFRHVKNELKRPQFTMPDRDRGAVFMRWKERFLVPDHRVQDINGASFAGFYYVCVDFNPQSSANNTRSVTHSIPLRTEESVDIPLTSSPSPGKMESVPTSRRRRDSSVRRGGCGSSIGPRSAPPAATMSGFYFHQNSEPYQQLSLSHIPERSSSSFEFR